MERWMAGCAALSLALSLGQPAALAEYDVGRKSESSYSPAKESDRQEDFSRSVDLDRFRKGNFEWDTQELIRSGFLALHRDNTKILEELAQLHEEVRQLKAGKGK